MHYEFVAGLEVTYGNALAAGGGFHRVTTAEGVAAEVAPHTYLWYKLSTEAAPTSESDSEPLAITHLCIGDEHSPSGNEDTWIKLDKSVDRQKGHYLWYRASRFEPTLSPSAQKKEIMPLKEIRVVRDLKDVPENFESLDEPLLSADDVGSKLHFFLTIVEGISSTNARIATDTEKLRTYLCFQRLTSEDCTSSKWNIINQKVGYWIDVKDLSSNKWSVAQILQHSASEIRVHIPTWEKGRDEVLSGLTCRNRVAKLGTHTNVYMSPAYPFPRKQGSMWSATMKDLQHAREQFTKYFYDRDKQKSYLPRILIPFVEKSLLCTFISSDLADEMNAFHQHVLKNVIACMLGNDADSLMVYMLSLLRMILNGHSSCMYFYIKYPGSYMAAKYQCLVYTSYLVTPDALATIPSRHPCRSLYFIDNVDLFVQARGFQLILERLASQNIALVEVLLYCTLLNKAKPCLVQHKKRRNSSSTRRHSATEAQSEDFFREFWNATFSRLRRMTGDELKDDDGLIDHIVGVLNLLCRDGLLLGSRRAGSDIDKSTATDTVGSASDMEFAEAIEIFYLDLSKKFICCPYLSQRLLGISRINELITMAQRRNANQRKTSSNLRRTASAETTTSNLIACTSSTTQLYLGDEPVTKWLRTKYIVEWLVSSDILEVILGNREICAKYALQEGTHLEILKRSIKIFGFVAALGLLTEEHIVLLWKTALSQLRSGRKAVFDILITLCNVLPADSMDVVVVLLTQIPVSNYDELVVDFIKRIIMIASKLNVDTETSGSKMSLTSLVSAASGSRSKLSFSAQKEIEIFNKVVSLCCTLYWNAILQIEAYSEGRLLAFRDSMRAEIITALADSLNYVQKLWMSSDLSSSTSGKDQQQLLYDYLCKCAKNIESGTLVETSMNLIERIVNGYGGGSASLVTSLTKVNSSSATSSELLKELNTAYNIVCVVVEAITTCVAQSESRSQSAYLGAIRMRLRFLAYVVTNSDLHLPFEALCILWKCFNSPESTKEEHRLFFAWFTDVLPDPNNFVHRAYSGHTGFAEAVVGEIFQCLIRPHATIDNKESASQIRFDMQTMSEESFWALERLFRFVNISTRKISFAAAVRSTAAQNDSYTIEDSKLFVVEAMDLEGLESLYDVALRAKSDIVSQQATNYLIYLHLHVGSKLVRREVWADFVGRCLWKLKEEIQFTINPSKKLEVLRLLILLSTFLFQSVVHTQDGAGAEGAFDGPEELNVYVRTQGGRVAAPFRYHLKRTSLVSELRDRIAKDTGHPADRVRIVNSAKAKLTAHGHGKFTLEKARVLNGYVRPLGVRSEKLPLTQKTLALSCTAKRISYVEAILLSKAESDTSGHTSRNVLDFHGAAGVAAAVAAGAGGNGINSSPASDWHAIITEISGNETWVVLLFDLLSYNDGIAEEAWKILKLLTTNESMEKQMRTLNNVLAIDGSFRKKSISFEWEMLLESNCPPKLLYQLELVEKFALCGNGRNGDDYDEEENLERLDSISVTGSDDLIGTVNLWSASFIELGGQTRLEQFVLSPNLHQLLGQGPLYVMCLSKLVKLLRHFVLVESKLAGINGDVPKENLRQLVYQLLETLSFIQAGEKASKDALSPKSTSKRQSKASRKDPAKSFPLTMYTRPQVENPDNVDKIPSDAYLMTRLLSCIGTCTVVANQGALVFVETSPDHGKVILDGLVESCFKPVRLGAANVIADLSTSRNKLQIDRVACCNYFLQLLGGYTGTVRDEEYYNIFTLLVTSAENLTKFAILPSCQILCRRITTIEIENETFGALASSVPAVTARTVSMDESRRVGLPRPAPRNQVASSAPDALLEGQLSTLLSIIKRIPAALADKVLDVPRDGRSLREVVASRLHDQGGIIHELFHECLFATPNGQTKGESQCGKSDNEVIDIQACSTSQYYLQQPKCRSDSCRKIAFDLLMELSIDNTDGLRYLLTQMADQHTFDHPSQPVVTSKALKHKRKSSKSTKEQMLQRGKYVGLKNLGCTCYLNSTVQSFFMMPRFRRQVLRLQANGNGGNFKSLTFELQSLFAHLEGSAKPYYNPRPFTRAMKTWDGESMDVNVQQDASEFLTSFFQQIESEMNGNDAENGEVVASDDSILSTFFGGEFSNELVAEGNRYSERFEPFYCISVPVRDRKNLKESLDGWVQGEKVSYTWEQSSDSKNISINDDEEQSKVTLESHKRISISKLPVYLIIHLKRFEFDFEKMQQIKLHDRFEFPTELDMYPYTKGYQQEKRKRSVSSVDDGNSGHDVRLSTSSNNAKGGRTTAPEYSQYELVGTIVHLGTAQSGHYYSFLRDQQTPCDVNHWYEFNDTLVTPFDPAKIPEECFGGNESAPSRQSSATTESYSPKDEGAFSAKMKNRSSFMLFYTRVTSKLRHVENEDTSCVNFSAVVLVVAFCFKIKRQASARLAHLRRVVQVIAPEPIRKLIAMENRLFWRKKYLYDTRCLNFTYHLLRSCLVGFENAKSMALMPRFEPVEVQFEALQVATKFVFGTLWQSGNVGKLLEWRLILQSLYHSDVIGCRWFLTTMKANESLLLELLVFNEHQEVRELMVNVISEATITTSNASGDAQEVSNLSVNVMEKKLPVSFEFMFFVIQLMPALLSVPVHHHRQYFLTMYEFVQTGRNEGSFLVVNSVVGAIVSLLTGLGNTQPLLQSQLKKHKSKQILKRIDLNVTILKLLSVLIRCSVPPTMDVKSDAKHPLILPANMAQEHVDLTPADQDVLLNERFVTLLTQRANHYTKETKPLEQIVSHLCWESRRVTAAFFDKIMHGIEVEDHHDVKPYFRTLNSLLKIRDSLAGERLTDGLTKLVAVMASQQRYYKATETSLDMLTRLAKRHSGVTQWLRSNRQSCMWMEKWLLAHCGAEGYLQQRKTVLVKPNSTSSWVNVSVTSTGLIKAIDRFITKLLPRLRSILDPDAVVETFYDSDDNPQRLVGKRVQVKWAKDKWYEGVVQEFNEETYEHFVVYDDGDKRSYHMSEKLFYVMGLTSSPSSRKQ